MPTAPDRGRQRGHPLGMGQRRGNPRHRPNPPGARPRTTCPHRGRDHRTRNRRVSAQPPRRPGHPTHAGPASIPTAPGFLRRHPHDRGTHRKPGQRSRFHHQHPRGPRIGQPSTAHHRIDLHQRTMQRLPRRARTTHPPQHPATPTRNRPTTPTPTLDHTIIQVAVAISALQWRGSQTSDPVETPSKGLLARHPNHWGADAHGWPSLSGDRRLGGPAWARSGCCRAPAGTAGRPESGCRSSASNGRTQTGLIADKGERARARRCALCSDAVPDRR